MRPPIRPPDLPADGGPQVPVPWQVLPAKTSLDVMYYNTIF